MNEISVVSFFFKKSLFSLDICRSHALFINTKKVKIFGCTYFEDIKTSNNFFRAFVSILLRVYLNYILSLLNEVEFSEYQAISLERKFSLVLAAFSMSFAFMLTLTILMFFFEI